MKISLALILLTFLIFQNMFTLENILISTENNPNTNNKDSLILADSIVETEAINFPWSPNNSCELGNYNAQGIIPAMRDSLVKLSLEKRLTNGLNPSKASSNYHGMDFSSNGINYSAAIDISVRCLSEDEIRTLLDELSFRGFAGWYRKNGKDGWSGANHIHAIWVASPLKQQLVLQVKKWLSGRNGLKSDKEYKFWTPKPKALEQIRSTFTQSNPN